MQKGIIRKRFLIPSKWLMITVLVILSITMGETGPFTASILAAESLDQVFSLKQVVERALDVNLNLKAAQKETEAAEYSRRVSRSFFLPSANLSYQYQRNDEEFRIQGFGIITPQDRYSFAASISQPLFTGFSLINRYEASKLRLETAQTSETVFRQDIILEAKRNFFTLLRSQKLLEVAKAVVKSTENQEEVARQFYEVGMTPLNDLLKAQVELANARQELIVAQNNLDVAEANFNTLLRRPVTAPVNVEDILEYTSFTTNLDDCLKSAEDSRLEIKQADLEVAIAEKDVEIAKKDFYPYVNLNWTYYQEGTDWDTRGDAGLYSDASGWNVKAMASWDLWQWGRTHYGTKERLARLEQARLRKEALLDQIQLQVTDAYKKTVESEKAIVTAQAAIDQAKENFRITQERYGAQMATSLEVFDAQTLLSRAMTNYYSALYFFKITKSSLYRAIGQEILE